MEYFRTEILDVLVIKPKVFKDDRGYFLETYKEKELNDFLGFEVNFCQENESKSSFGVLRGLHFQNPPFSQAKLVRVIQGNILDVVVDIRKGSKTFGKHISIELNEINKKQLFIPRGFAHGFLVLSETAIVSYKVDNLYNPDYEDGIMFNDEMLNIDWKISYDEIILSEKDLKYKPFKSMNVQ